MRRSCSDLACDLVVENLQVVLRKALEKLVDGEDLFVIQPTVSGKSVIVPIRTDDFR